MPSKEDTNSPPLLMRSIQMRTNNICLLARTERTEAEPIWAGIVRPGTERAGTSREGICLMHENADTATLKKNRTRV